MSVMKQKVQFEHEATRMSVVIRLSLLLGAIGSLIGCVGLAMFFRQAVGGELMLGIGVGLLFSAGVVGLDAARNMGQPVRCTVQD